MSASLVGSEMCIRDRVETVLPDWADGPPAGLALDHYAQVLGRPDFEPEDCLLYTSDAADDM
eukprot:7100847-Alexandrium_andersonii.AAC.1